ncbi:MAG: SGNH/GDSL hydrolase family protein [Methylobacteriaceae bacterium]|nr:SGNH/GDSL hydrolase family protein [Methylobacteriaceae bacterium]
MLYLVGVNLAVFVALFVAFELAVHILYPDQNPWLGPPFAKSKVRIANPVYGHALAPNFDSEEVWGQGKSHITTNSLGFKDVRVREVPLQSAKKRILFLGDSFTEGIGLPYEQTFVGQFAAAFPQLDVLNAAASSYAPTIYNAKARYLIEAGLQVDEVIVYIDISDIQDEAITYRTDKDGKVEEGDFDDKCPTAPQIIRIQSPWWAHFSYTLDFLHKRHILMQYRQVLPDASLALLMQPGQVYAKDFHRPAWTYESNLQCYSTLGVEGAIAKAINQMDQLYAFLSERRIPLSVGVYPWPQQLLYDKEESRQVTIWREWCKNKCRRFFNHFPAFFAYKRQHPDFMHEIFIWGDSHYNALGNELLAHDLIAQYP